MKLEKRYLVIANANAQIGVTVRDDFTERPGDVILYQCDSIDEAFDYKDDVDAEIARMMRLHCPTC